jgi:hypothetical protein
VSLRRQGRFRRGPLAQSSKRRAVVLSVSVTAGHEEDNRLGTDGARLVDRCLRAKAFEDEIIKVEPAKSGRGTSCGVCMEPYPKTRTVNCGDVRHSVCVHCFRGYVLTTHGATGMAGVPCTAAASEGCTHTFPPSAFRACLSGA